VKIVGVLRAAPLFYHSANGVSGTAEPTIDDCQWYIIN